MIELPGKEGLFQEVTLAKPPMRPLYKEAEQMESTNALKWKSVWPV